MKLRARWLQAPAALLYLGPLLAGFSGYGWALLPPFVLIFCLWLVQLWPQYWPRRWSHWRKPRLLTLVISQVLTQIALVTLLFAIGRGLAGVAGGTGPDASSGLPALSLPLLLGLSFLALPLSRLLWDGEKALKHGVRLEELRHPPVAEPQQPPHARPEAEIAPLLAFADDAPVTEIAPVLEDVMDAADAWHRLELLGQALAGAPDQHGALRRALLLWATEPEVFASGAAPTAIRTAFAAAGQDLPLLQMLLPRAASLVRSFPDRRHQFPDAQALQRLSKLGLPNDLAADLATLTATVGRKASRRAWTPHSRPQPG
ncbi:hypothetical protein Q9295_13820 [Xinfangfangia sp. CPCC 101601]|uniref:HEAT repeat domain-containing protein n=1 Tax=Pseudogemmobacter lacusdianii TaxID=3069608 RepID=A0ABU0W0A8_9RHOB|nr:hypothetical protein [Xinfangfangia sp. CPCC 101601]MDQ2067452.1 hypothetical protein [Xinfangfangia sp. CPCC 101601]